MVLSDLYLKRFDLTNIKILDHIEQGWQGEEWTINMSQTVNEILRQNSLTTKTPPATRTNHEAHGIQWIRMEELGKALTN